VNIVLAEANICPSSAEADAKLNIQTTYVPTQLPIFRVDLRKLLTPHLNLAKEAIAELCETHPQSPESNVYATYMSPWKSHLLNAKLTPLCDSIVTIAKLVSQQVLSANLDALQMQLIVSDCWGIIYENADYTRLHNHFPAEYGCAIYLEADEGCAPIIFAGHHAIQPEAGTAVIFPGILNHEVPANTGKRTVLAINLVKVPRNY
jgi:hypothetical protein